MNPYTSSRQLATRASQTLQFPLSSLKSSRRPTYAARPQVRTMATASHVELSPATAGVFHVPTIEGESAKVGSHLLQENHDIHHMYFNPSGFHNHIAHHLLSVFALGASPQQLQKAFDLNKGYQRRQFPVHDQVVHDMADKHKFTQFLGKEKYFHDYMVFFQREIEANGWEAVLNEHLFARDEHAELMLTRLFAGFLHPLIHLGFGVEFKQPAIIAEALAQAATHSNWIAGYLLGAEKIACSSQKPMSETMVDLIREIRSTEKLRTAAHLEDDNKIRDGILTRAPDEFMHLAAKWRVSPDELEEKTAQMINADVYYAGAAQNPSKQIKFDFFYMHSVNASIFYSTFLREPWLSMENKVRLLEWKGRIDLAMYASRGCPELLVDEITNYKPKKEGDWSSIFQRVDRLEDDGHASKLVRALAHGEQACKPFESKKGFEIKGDMWLQLGHMAIDSVEGARDRWVRNTGWDVAWKDVPDRAKI